MQRVADETSLDWRAAALFGLITSTFSTVTVTLGAARVGRDIRIDWMIVGTVLLRDGGLQAEPGWREVAAGILVHQFADFGWALLFFSLLGRWTRGLEPFALFGRTPSDTYRDMFPRRQIGAEARR